MAFDAASSRRTLVAQLKAAAPPRPSPDAQAYLGSPVPVLGVRVPRLRTLVSAFRKAHRDIEVGDVNRLAAILWKGSTFEEKALAITLLDTYAKILDEASWRIIDSWVDQPTGWGWCALPRNSGRTCVGDDDSRGAPNRKLIRIRFFGPTRGTSWPRPR